MIIRTAKEREAESTDSTLAGGRAAVDAATRKTLYCVSSGYTRCWLPPRRGEGIYPSLSEALRHRLVTTCDGQFTDNYLDNERFQL